MTKKTKAIFLGTVVIVIIYLSFKLRNDEADNIKAFNEKGVGTIIHHGLKTINIGYNYHGRHYMYTRDIPFSNLVEGEQYEIEIYRKDPSRILVSMDKPFIDTLNFKWSFVKPIKIHRLFIDRGQVEFTYLLNDISHRRIQEFYHSDSVPKDLKKLNVVYRIDKPDISYLVYDYK